MSRLPDTARERGIADPIPASMKPRVINYQVNDICNARCVMCHVWKRRRGPELSPPMFGRLLGAPYFDEVRHLGITGGEPTLREDLADFYFAALDALPRLQGGHFITNGFSPRRALATFAGVRDRYAASGVSFGGMVSIDGLEEVHDRVRGRPTAFARASRTLFGLRDAGIPVLACCTIVSDNVYGLHDLLDWGQRHDIRLRFRVAEHIDRLYVDHSNVHIRTFDLAALKHLVSFFHFLLQTYEHEEAIRRTYASILSVLTGGSRKVGCPYQSPSAISIDCEGRFAHCAPRGIPHPLGAEPGIDILKREPDRKLLIAAHCSSCIHDYHADWSPGETAWRLRSTSAAQQLYGVQPDVDDKSESPHVPVPGGSLTHVLLVGWYGTETAGDIAILAAIARKYLDEHPGCRLTLLSLYPTYSMVTRQDLPADIRDALTIRGYETTEALEAADTADAIVMAGGPLMDIPQVAMIASLFARFRDSGRPRIIDGCGIGPLNDERYRKTVAWLARAATQVTVRDHAGVHKLRQWGIGKPVGVAADPAASYIAGLGERWHGERSNTIRCFLRELTPEYPQATTPDEARDRLTGLLRRLLHLYPDCRIELLPMHYFPVGNDDRVFARMLGDALGDDRIAVEMRPLSPAEIVRRMADARFCVCMRFHSVVFAHTIGAPYLAIDYTNGGKITGFLEDVNNLESCRTLQDLTDMPDRALLDIRRPGRSPAGTMGTSGATEK